MTTTPADSPASHVAPSDRRTPISTSQYDWLTQELAKWRGDGVLGDAQATAILGRYRATKSLSLARLMLTLGAAFVGFGLIWLVAANLDQLPPLLRFGAVALIWLALLGTAEFLASRRAHGGTIASPVVAAFRVLTALAFGAVIFQAAQSLQVPAFEPRLVGCWAAGALLYAYAVRSIGPLVVGAAAGAGWLVWQVLESSPNVLTGVTTVLAVGVIFAAIAVIHERRIAEFDQVWREFGAVLSLGGLFAAALPLNANEHFGWSPSFIGVLIAAAVAVVLAGVFACERAKFEPLPAVAILGAGVLLASWTTGTDTNSVSPSDWGHAALSVLLYVAAAAWVAVLGILRDSPRLTWVATGALVIFTTFQSFAVFAQILQGGVLFVVLGVIFLATGYLFDRGRRRLAETLEGEHA